MLTDDRARSLLRSAVADLIVSEPPADELLRLGRRSQRRTRVVAALGVAAAAGVVVAGSVALTDLVGTTADEPPAAPATAVSDTPPSTQSSPMTPPGTRLVGMGGVAVAVPEGWGTNDARCGEAVDDTVIFLTETSEGAGCGRLRIFGPASLTIAAADSQNPRVQHRVNTATVRLEVDGLTVFRSPAQAAGTGPGGESSDQPTGAVVVPAENVVMWAVAPNRGVVDRILDSVQPLPPGTVVVPAQGSLKEVEAAVETAGLHVRERTVHRPGIRSGLLLSSDPPLGSVVPQRSTVTLSVSKATTQTDADYQTLSYLHQLATGDSPTPPKVIGPYIPVTLGLGDQVIRDEHLPNLDNPRVWVIRRDFFNGYAGPFSARDYLATDPDTWTVTEEGQLACRRAADLPGFQKDRRLTIEPADISACTEWWAVDVYLDERGSIDAISLNLVEP